MIVIECDGKSNYDFSKQICQLNIEVFFGGTENLFPVKTLHIIHCISSTVVAFQLVIVCFRQTKSSSIKNAERDIHFDNNA